MRRGRRTTLTLVILLLAIGFAGVTTTLVMNGASFFGINEADYSVYFSKAILDGVDETNTIISNDRLNINFTSKELSRLGDTSVLEYEVTNDSTQYDAEVTVECKGLAVNAYASFTNTLENQIIPAQSKAEGILTVTLEKVYTGDEVLEEEIQCTILATAVERGDSIEDIPVVTSYYANAYLSTPSGAMLSNTNLVIYGNETKYTTTDDRGFFHISDLDSGEYQIYVVLNKTLQELEVMSEEELIASATYTGSFTTSSAVITFTDLVVEDSDIAPGDPATYEILLDVGEGQESDYNILVVEDKTVGRLPIASHATLAFIGWYSETTEYTSDVVVTSSIPTTLVAKYGEGVAQIGEIQYGTIQQAYDSITGDAETEIDVIASHSITSNIRANKNVILDLNDYTVDFAEYYMLNTANVTIDNGTIETHGIYAFHNEGTATLESDLVINIDDSAYTDTAHLTPPLANLETGTMDINGTTINAEFTSNYARAILNMGTLNINDGNMTASGTSTGIVTNEGTLNMIAGTYDISNTTLASVLDSQGESTTNIGAEGKTLNIIGNNSVLYTITALGTLNITAGTINLSNGYAIYAKETLNVGETDKSLNVTLASGSRLFSVASNAKATINNGNLTATNGYLFYIEDGATIDINNGTMNSSNTYLLYIEDGGLANINNGSLTSTNSTLLYIKANGTANINGGSLTVDSSSYHGRLIDVYGNLNVNAGTLTAKGISYGLIEAQGNAIVNLKGGIYNNTAGKANLMYAQSNTTINIGSDNSNITLQGVPSYPTIFSEGTVLYLGGTLTHDVSTLFRISGKLTVNKGTFNLTEGMFADIETGGTADIYAGTFNLNNPTAQARMFYNEGIINIYDGTFTAQGSISGIVDNATGGTFNVSGGTYNTTEGEIAGIIIYENSTMNLGSPTNTITFNGKTNYYTIANEGTLNISEGNININNATLIATNGNVNIGETEKKPTFTLGQGVPLLITDEGANVNIYNMSAKANGAYLIYNYTGSTMNIYDGDFSIDTATSDNRLITNSGTMTIHGGTYTSSLGSAGLLTAVSGSVTNIISATITGETNSSNLIYGDTGSTINFGQTGSTANLKITCTTNDNNSPAIVIFGTANVYSGQISSTLAATFLVGNTTNTGTLNIYGGTISNNSTTNSTIVTVIGTITMTGGSVINNSGNYTIYNENGNATQTGGTSANNYNVKTS